MQLWTDYEGVTIDGAFPLKKLLLPEGRSAFFSTANGKGEPVVLRLIECHFDEEEILARWRSMEALNHPNFLKLERYGQIEIDGSPVVYAVFEKVDANLAGVLDQGHLSVKDTAQLALSLTSALEVLHTHGFTHEHVSAGNIFAIGDIVKLRSDCIREAPEGEEGVAAKRRDVHDLALVLVQALTRRQSLEGIPESAVPPPFDKIVRYGMNGTWGLTEIRAALEGRFKPMPPSLFSPSHLSNSTGNGMTAAKPAAEARPSEKVAIKTEPSKLEEPESENVVRSKMRQDLWDAESERYFSLQTKWLGAAALAVMLLFLSFWFYARTRHGIRGPVQPVAASRSSAPAVRIPAPKKQAPAITPPQRVNQPPTETNDTGTRTQWRVIAFTYNRKEDAQKKADTIAQKHPDLQAAVFSPKGRAPYLVSIGGVMNKDAAFALAHRSRGMGLPRDTYAQNYSGSSR